MKEIILAPNNESNIFVFADSDVEKELKDFFSFDIPGSRYMKQSWRKHWNGKISVFNLVSKTMPKGLIPRVISWAESRGYGIKNNVPPLNSLWTESKTYELLEKYPVVDSIEIRDYQIRAIEWALQKQRCVLISPTASGKSLCLYYIVRSRMEQGPVLLIVPNISLVAQMKSDWKEYGWEDVDDYVHQITAGANKNTDKPCVISTWQSIYQQDEKWFNRYESLLIDEAHLASAKSLAGIASKMTNCSFRIGVTGTLDDAKAHRLVVEGALGKGFKVAKTSDLQAKGYLSPIVIQGHYLNYSTNDKFLFHQGDTSYQNELDYIVNHPKRMEWLIDFVGKLNGNVLLLFNFIEKHGLPIYEKLKDKYGNTRPVHYVVGEVDGLQREDIRKIIDSNEIIILEFPSKTIKCTLSTNVLLSNGSTKLASDLTIDDDIDDVWIKNKY